MRTSFWDRMLSYLMPVTKKVESKYTGSAELNLINGKYTLDAANANYSYGSLQRILKAGLQGIEPSNNGSILLLGVAGGSVIETLRKDFGYEGHITGIEIDPAMLQIADAYFDIRSDERTELIEMDAVKYVANAEGSFDLIIVDLFFDDQIPENAYKLVFWENLIRISDERCTILFNTINSTAKDLVSIALHMQNKGWRMHRLKNLEGTNDVYLFISN